MSSGAAPIRLPATLTMGEARQVLADLARQLEAQPQPVIDAAPLTQLDTAAVAVLLECQRLAAARAQPLTITGAPAKLRQLATLYGVDGLLALDAPPA